MENNRWKFGKQPANKNNMTVMKNHIFWRRKRGGGGGG